MHTDRKVIIMGKRLESIINEDLDLIARNKLKDIVKKYN